MGMACKAYTHVIPCYTHIIPIFWCNLGTHNFGLLKWRYKTAKFGLFCWPVLGYRILTHTDRIDLFPPDIEHCSLPKDPTSKKTVANLSNLSNPQRFVEKSSSFSNGRSWGPIYWPRPPICICCWPRATRWATGPWDTPRCGDGRPPVATILGNPWLKFG